MLKYICMRASSYAKSIVKPIRSIQTGPPLIECKDDELKQIFEKDLIIKEDFISEEEEASLLNEIEPYMKRLRYEYDHWDEVS